MSYLIHTGNRYEHNNVILLVDSVSDDTVFYRRWRSGGDGSLENDFNNFLGAHQTSIAYFQQEIEKINNGESQ